MIIKVRDFRRDDSIIGHLVTSPSFARQSPLANDGDDTRWRMIESSLLKVSAVPKHFIFILPTAVVLLNYIDDNTVLLSG